MLTLSLTGEWRTSFGFWVTFREAQQSGESSNVAKDWFHWFSRKGKGTTSTKTKQVRVSTSRTIVHRGQIPVQNWNELVMERHKINVVPSSYPFNYKRATTRNTTRKILGRASITATTTTSTAPTTDAAVRAASPTVSATATEDTNS